jgi:hypothetical protein
MVGGVDAGVANEEGPNPSESAPSGVEQGEKQGERHIVADMAGSEGASVFDGAGIGDFHPVTEAITDDAPDVFLGLVGAWAVDFPFEGGVDARIADQKAKGHEQKENAFPKFSEDQEGQDSGKQRPFQKIEIGDKGQKTIQYRACPLRIDPAED